MNGLIEGCVKQGILEKAGSWYKYNGENIAQGMKKLLVLLEENPELLKELEEEYKVKTA